MKNSRLISDLYPYVAQLRNKLIEKCRNKGIEILVTSTLRNAEYQRYLYEKVPGSTNTPYDEVLLIMNTYFKDKSVDYIFSYK